MNRLVLLIFLFALPQVASAISYSTPNGTAASGLASSIEYYKRENGRLPKSWAEISQYFNGHVGEVFPYAQPSKRYAILRQAVPYDLLDERVKAILIMRSPFRDSDRNWWFFSVKERPKREGTVCYLRTFKRHSLFELYERRRCPQGLFRCKYIFTRTG